MICFYDSRDVSVREEDFAEFLLVVRNDCELLTMRAGAGRERVPEDSHYSGQGQNAECPTESFSENFFSCENLSTQTQLLDVQYMISSKQKLP